MGSIALGSTEHKTYVEAVGPGRGRPDRPALCPFCDGTRVWFNGWRIVFCVVLADGRSHRFDEGLPVQRVLCAGCRTSWALRPGFLYPRRSLEPDVAEAASSSYLSEASATYDKTAQAYRCSPRTVWRWISWLAGLVAVPAVLSEVERRMGSGRSPDLMPRVVPQDHRKAYSTAREQTLLLALQVLSALVLWSRAQPVPPTDPSPLRSWLHHRFRAFREIHRSTGAHLSPRLPEDSTGPPRIDGRHELR